MWKNFKRFIKRRIDGSWVFREQIAIEKWWAGNDYGGFFCCPAGLDEKSVVYSVGIGEDISFDRAIIERFGCQVHGFDPTPKSIKWIEKQSLPQAFHFHPYGISDSSGMVEFHLPLNENHVSGSLVSQRNVGLETVAVPMKRLAEVAAELGHKHLDILKMDIEGAEYQVIDDLISSGLSIRQILIEFHYKMMDGGIEKTKLAIEKLNAAGYRLFAISEKGEEMSFIKTV